MSSRRVTLWASALAVALIAVPAVIVWSPRLIWNASASVPIGLYAVQPVGRIEIGNLVAVQAPDKLATFLAARGYLPTDVPLLKHIVALPGAEVCRLGDEITVNGTPLGMALARDRMGRDLPVWRGCRVIAGGEVFLMNPDAPDSLDGRYFGPLPASTITARLTPLWTDAAGDGRFIWRGAAP
ncbi:MAG: S26 family signal peptidase [Paracoccus denitrificans]|jgi:conjugative transfer signal peptidase TraF|uniref:S26 family signal peptidase n=1 Tax=Paracoccus denitrificans TaxID=266 RepID=A0A533I5H7_PARDE|nr:MAG: S26 family signal peptidase [Paracoccus denitrificans]